jgi:hypothetical protein
MFPKHKIVAVLAFLALALSAMAIPVVTPPKKAAGKHHAKMFPARHNAGRPNHP